MINPLRLSKLQKYLIFIESNNRGNQGGKVLKQQQLQPQQVFLTNQQTCIIHLCIYTYQQLEQVMGGHGGLNILPQKKWNVYNHDNRAIVAKDKKQAKQKEERDYQKNRDDRLMGKMDVLKAERGLGSIDPNGTKGEQDALICLLEAKQREGDKKHINLFENEQKIIENNQIKDIKQYRERDFIKDKNIDLTTRFSGSYTSPQNIPWYAKSKGTVQSKKRKIFAEELISVKKSDSYTTKEVVRLQSQRGDKHHRDQNKEHSQRSRDKGNGDSQRCDKFEESGSPDIDRLREKRLRREKKERQRAEKLKSASIFK